LFNGSPLSARKPLVPQATFPAFWQQPIDPAYENDLFSTISPQRTDNDFAHRRAQVGREEKEEKLNNRNWVASNPIDERQRGQQRPPVLNLNGGENNRRGFTTTTTTTTTTSPSNTTPAPIPSQGSNRPGRGMFSTPPQSPSRQRKFSPMRSSPSITAPVTIPSLLTAADPSSHLWGVGNQVDQSLIVTSGSSLGRISPQNPRSEASPGRGRVLDSIVRGRVVTLKQALEMFNQFKLAYNKLTQLHEQTAYDAQVAFLWQLLEEVMNLKRNADNAVDPSEGRLVRLSAMHYDEEVMKAIQSMEKLLADPPKPLTFGSSVQGFLGGVKSTWQGK